MTEQQKQTLFDNFWLQVGDTVEHYRKRGIKGKVISIDFDSYPFYEYGTTTCEVLWKYSEDGVADVQWDNKLVLVNE